MEVQSHTASLETLSVTIQALHVNNKQMTLAVFRQLPTHPILDAAGEFDKHLAPWGWVRYPIKDEADEWAVCQIEGRLVRCPMYSPRLCQYDQRCRSEHKVVVAAETALKQASDPTLHKLREEAVVRAIERFAAAENDLDMATRQAAATRKIKAETPQLFIAV